MKIDIDYKRTPEQKEAISNSDLTYNYIASAVNQHYEKGLEGQKRRIWARIQRKFDDAIDSNKKTIELEEAEKDFIKEAFDTWKSPAPFAKFIDVLADEINEKDSVKEK